MELFEQLFVEIKQFIFYAEKAPEQRSEYGVEHNEPTSYDVSHWQELVDDIKATYESLQVMVTDGVEKNLVEIDTQLDAFRELSRRMDYNDCYWSAYESDIRNTMKKMMVLVDEIDERYKIGWCQEKYGRS